MSFSEPRDEVQSLRPNSQSRTYSISSWNSWSKDLRKTFILSLPIFLSVTWPLVPKYQAPYWLKNLLLALRSAGSLSTTFQRVSSNTGPAWYRDSLGANWQGIMNLQSPLWGAKAARENLGHRTLREPGNFHVKVLAK